MATVIQTQQDKHVPLLIRDDGMLVPNVPALAKMPNFRPYHGDPEASDEQRAQYLAGFAGSVQKNADAELGAFDIGTASKDELIEFALDEFGLHLDKRKSLENLRAEVAAAAEKAK